MPSVNLPLPEPPALESMRGSVRLTRAGMDRWERKGDPSDKEVLLRIYSEVSVLADEMEMRLGLASDSDTDD